MADRIIALMAVLFFIFNGVVSAQRWTTIDPQTIESTGDRDIVPDAFIAYEIDVTSIQSILWQAPDEVFQPVATSQVLLTVGMANGCADIFRIVEYDMMEAPLASLFPAIRTYRGISVSNPYRTLRADWTENGFRALIRDETGTTYIDPYQRGDLAHRIAYYKQDISREGDWTCGFQQEQISGGSNSKQRFVGDCIFRSYRLAVAASGEYSNFFGATGPGQSGLVLSQIVTAVNRVNDVYEIDISVRLILIGNTTSIFYYSPASDPYTPDNACVQLGENQTAVDAVIGNANYDIGHVFGVGSGGCAGLGVICSTGNKARGATGLNPPTGDPFYIDYVAHELGHQFGGNHTQNNACNRNAATAMEPGSASTIMGYAGICSPDVQPNSDAYFHGISQQEIANEIATTNCAVTISTANSAPVVSNVPNYTIPVSTPFVLTATSTDANNNPMTYCWEQWDQEVGTMPPAATNAVGPMFRSLNPSTNPSRYFYNLTDLTNNVNPVWEELPSVGRQMEFRVTVRDLYNGNYGCTDEDNVIVTTHAAAGPFTVTSQNSGATWQEASTQTITWNVANTTASPVSCPNVDIRLSYDGGFTYPGVVSLNEPNDGSATVTIPPGTTTDGRIMVKASNNVFFDINNADLLIEAGVPNFTISLNPQVITECNDGSVQTTVEVGSFMGFTNPVTLSILNTPPGAIVTFIPPIVIPGNTSTLTISNLTGLFGTYTPIVRGTSTTGSKDSPLTINLLSTPASGPTLTSPVNNAPDAVMTPLLDWAAIAGVTLYEYQVSSNNGFTSIVQSGTVVADQVQITNALIAGNQYWWRVRASNSCGIGPWSSTFTFTTISCFALNSTHIPVTIPPVGTITSTFVTPIAMTINDVNVINLAGAHTWVDDLKFTLESPNGTDVVIWDRPCQNHDNFSINFDDEAAPGNWPCPPTNGLTYRPSNTMTLFDGGPSAGTWTLKIDDLVDPDAGSLTSWGLRVCGVASCVLTVNQPSGTGPGTLPGALGCALPGDTVFLSAALSDQTINIGNAPLQLSKNVVIMALGPNINVTGTGSRVFEVSPGTVFEINGLVITAGTSMTGGALANQGNLTLANVTFRKNTGVTGASLVQNTGGQLKLVGNCSFTQ